MNGPVVHAVGHCLCQAREAGSGMCSTYNPLALLTLFPLRKARRGNSSNATIPRSNDAQGKKSKQPEGPSHLACGLRHFLLVVHAYVFVVIP